MMDFIIEMLNITKEFPGITANDDITLQVRKGEIHALLGENGAGKSTLMSILFGLYQPERGTVKVGGRQVGIHNPNEANELGIGMVHQHFKLVHNFTVLENVILGVENTKRGMLVMDAAREKVISLSERYNLKVDPDALISDITVGMQQRVEILKMLYRDNEILIFDEPTAALTPQEIRELMKIMRMFAQEGKSILFITHKLDEIKEAADRCTILRKGKCIGTVDVAPTTKEELSEMMVGRKVSLVVEKRAANPQGAALEVEGLNVKSKDSRKDKIRDISFRVQKGEIVCVAGIEGNGQTDLISAIVGLTDIQSGQIRMNGEDITHKSVRYRSTHGMSHIPEDRHKHGLVLDYNVAENLVLQTYFREDFQRKGFIRFDSVYAHAEKMISRYDIRCGQGAYSKARGMSGGNQQKAIIAREMDRDHDLLLAVQPTRGLDVGAIENVHRQLIEERDSGKGVLLVSLELDEVMNVSDRILVMYEGEIVADLYPGEVTVQELGLYMAGAKKGDVKWKNI